MVFGDLQCSSQVGNIAKFQNFHLLCPTEREARISIGAQDEGIEWVARAMIERTGASNLIMKLGSDGFIAYSTEADGFINSQHFPALNPNPVDVAGAGDSLLSAVAVGICSKNTLMQSSALGACMASLAVDQVGNLPVNRQQLLEYLKRI